MTNSTMISYLAEYIRGPLSHKASADSLVRTLEVRPDDFNSFAHRKNMFK